MRLDGIRGEGKERERKKKEMSEKRKMKVEKRRGRSAKENIENVLLMHFLIAR